MALIWPANAWKADYSIVDTALLNYFHFNFWELSVRPVSVH